MVIGHRGAPAQAPENTLLSFETALRMGADMIELDIQQTADGHIVCIHDEEVDRTTDGHGNVCELTYDQIRALDAGSGQRIPLLTEVLDFAKGKIGVNIEIKAPNIEERALKMVKERNMLGEVIFSSFLHKSLVKVKSLEPRAFTAVLYSSEMDDVVTYAKGLGADAINPLFFILDEETIRTAHEAGLRVYPWTLNDEEFITEYVRLGVDGVISDMPDLAAKVIDELLESQ